MWIFVWKKYPQSALATAVSFVGNIVVALAAIGGAVLLGTKIGGTAGTILALAVGIALYIGLRIGLNHWTDRLADKNLKSSVECTAKKTRKQAEEGRERDAQLLEALRSELDQDRLLKAVRESLTIKMGYVSSIRFEQSLAGAARLDQPHLTSLVQWFGGYAFNRLIQKQRKKAGQGPDASAQRLMKLIDCFPDPAQRAQLLAYYYLD